MHACWTDTQYGKVTMPLRVLFRHTCGPQACTCSIGLCKYCNKVISHVAYQNHTHESEYHTHKCENYTQTCENHTHECYNHMQGAKLHACYENHTRTCCIATSQDSIRIFWWFYVNFSWFFFRSHASCWNSTIPSINHTRAYRYHTRECHIHTLTCQNHILRVVMPVEITVMSVVFTFVGVKITLRVEITLCIYKSHPPCGNRTLRIQITPWE
jgi:hypothetical protein